LNHLTSLKRLRPHLLVYGLYLAVAVLMTWPLVTVMGTQFAGYPFGDSHEMTRHIWWFTYALRHGEPLVFQPLLGWPEGMSGVILWANPLQFFPGWLFALFLPLPAAYNLSALLTLALNGWAAHYLLRHLLTDERAALLGGLAFMAAPTIQGHLAGGHGGLLVQWPLPLLTLALLRVGGWLPSSSRRRDVLWAALWVFITPLGHTLQLIYAVLPLLAVLGAALLIRRQWMRLAQLMLAAALGAGLLALFLLPVAGATFGTSAYADEGGSVAFSADLLAPVTPSFNHPLFSAWDFPRRVLGVNIIEGFSTIGLIPALLALIALWRDRTARLWGWLGLVAFVLMLGPLLKVFDQPVAVSFGGYPSYIVLPFALVADLPILTLARTPGRFNFLLALAVAVLVGYGAKTLTSPLLSPEGKLGAAQRGEVKRQGILVLLFAALMLFELQGFWPLPTMSAAIPDAVQALNARTDIRAVLDIPYDNRLAAKDALWLQTAHEKPLIGGQVTRVTPVNPTKLNLLEQTLDLALLDEAGADVVIVHKAYDGDGAALERARTMLGQPTYEDAQIALFDVPAPQRLPPIFRVLPAASASPDRIEWDIYAPQSGWLNLTGALNSASRQAALWLDGVKIASFPAGDSALDSGVPLSAYGYHRLSLTALPVCGQSPSPYADCPPLRVTLAASALAFTGGGFAPPVSFAEGLRLMGGAAQVAGDTLTVDLWWAFDAARTDTDVRFVKVLNAAGEPVAGDDHPLGDLPPNTHLSERLRLTLPADLPSGEYRVIVGWYRYPELTRFTITSDVQGAADGLAPAAGFTIPATAP
jgi:hypothetical protein